MDTLEVYEEAIRQTEADLEQTTAHQDQANAGEVGGQPPSSTLEQPSSTNYAAQAGAGPKIIHPRSTKIVDPAKQQRQLQHMQNVALAGDKIR